jgi:hypothetical protein
MRSRSIRFLPPLCVVIFVAALSLWASTRSTAEDEPQPLAAPVHQTPSSRPQYNLNATIDYELLTFKSTGNIMVPVAAGDSLRDVVFFIYANASGVGGDDDKHKNIAVDSVTLDGKTVPFTLEGAVLRVKLAQEKKSNFTLKIDWHGVVPRSPAGSGGIADMMGGLGGDIGGLLGGLGGAAGGAQAKPKNVDYGLYTYGNGVLSLGSFWYPSLAVRKNGKWIDDPPEGLGDVGYTEMSDFLVHISMPENVKVAAPGKLTISTLSNRGREDYFAANNVRDFAVLMSEDFEIKTKKIEVAGKSINIQAFTTKKNAAKADKAIDIAAHAIEGFSKRFGPYPYDDFKVVEGPIRGGAGGMEFSGMTSIASMLYQDMGEQLEGLAGALGVGGLDKIMGALGGDDDADGKGDEAAAQNPAGEMLTNMLGEQKQIFDSLFEVTIAHEVAHQWWAIGVGSDSQRAPFVDESLANYSAMLYFEDRYGREAANKMADLHLRTAYSMGRMMGGGDAPVNLATAAYKNNMQYGAVVYAKGALFYDVLRKVVGDATFFAALREYYSRYGSKLADPYAFREIIEAKSPAKKAAIAALFKRWIEETHGDEDISGGKAMSIEDLLGGLMGGGLGGAEAEE